MSYRDLPSGARPSYIAQQSDGPPSGSHEYLDGQLYDGLPQRTSTYSRASMMGGGADRASFASAASSQNTLGQYASVPNAEKYGSTDALAGYGATEAPVLPRSSLSSRRPPPVKRNGNRRTLLIVAAIIALLVIGGIVAGVLVAKSNSDKSNRSSALGQADSASTSGTALASASASSAPVVTLVTQGGDGSMVTSIDGTQTFRYNNSYGGYWVSTPFNDSARAQDDVAPLNQPWNYSTMRLRGVNLGGWLEVEPFITPALFEPFYNSTIRAVDEWTLFQNLDAVSSTNKATVMNRHYSTFITERDFAQIAGAGLNWVRIPIPFFMFEVYPNEPFMTGQWTYLLKAFQWARKYGIRINLDMHSCPGSQNGYNHSGRGTNMVACLKGAMGVANAERLLNYLRVLTQFVSQPEYVNVVAMVSILNEPQANASNNGTGIPAMQAFNARVYSTLRSITGTGQGKGPMLAIGDAFLGAEQWYGFIPNADRLALDLHLYLVFTVPSNQAITTFAQNACGYATELRAAQTGFGFTSVGEWSLAVTDCGQYLNGVGQGTRYEGTFPGFTTAIGDCADWTDQSTWSAAKKANLAQLAGAWIDATQHSFFWTWRTEPNLAGQRPNPSWDMQLAMANGYWPTNMRNLTGFCSNIAGATVTDPFTAAFPASATGGAGAATVAAAALASYSWPPTMSAAGGTTYRYTQTQAQFTMPTYSPTPNSAAGIASAATYAIGNGWANAQDTALFYTPAASGTAYGDAWGQLEPDGTPILRARSPVRTPAPVGRRLQA